MTNSNRFKKAHEKAKQIRRFCTDYRTAFRLSLIEVYEEEQKAKNQKPLESLLGKELKLFFNYDEKKSKIVVKWVGTEKVKGKDRNFVDFFQVGVGVEAWFYIDKVYETTIGDKDFPPMFEAGGRYFSIKWGWVNPNNTPYDVDAIKGQILASVESIFSNLN